VDEVTVESVTDGDTIVVSGGIRVRLIGMDTPETRHPDRGVECFGPEASARTAELLSPGEPVRLVYDVDRADRYERTLAYVYRSSDGLFVNAVLVTEGYARAGTYPPNVAHDAEFRRLEDGARSAGRGLWTACAVGGAPPSQPNRTIPPLALARPTTATLTAWGCENPLNARINDWTVHNDCSRARRWARGEPPGTAGGRR